MNSKNIYIFKYTEPYTMFKTNDQHSYMHNITMVSSLTSVFLGKLPYILTFKLIKKFNYSELANSHPQHWEKYDTNFYNFYTVIKKFEDIALCEVIDSNCGDLMPGDLFYTDLQSIEELTKNGYEAYKNI